MVRFGSLLLGVVLLVGGFSSSAQADEPTGITVAQSGLNLVVSWSGGDAGTVSISSDNSFPDDETETCSTFAWSSPATVQFCELVTFSGTIYVQVDDTTISVPNTFDLSPVTTQPAKETWRNRQTVHCGAASNQWSRIDKYTVFRARITVGGRTKVSGDVDNPITGMGQSAVSPAVVTYALRGADVGRAATCEVSARNGRHATSRIRTATIGHATALQMNPRLILKELSVPSGYVYYEDPVWVSLTKAQRKTGALRKAHGDAAYGVSADLNLWAVTYRTTAEADRAVPKGFCASLIKSTRKASTPTRPQQVLQCSAGKVAHARRAYVALRAASGIAEDGTPVTSIQAIMVASAGNSAVTLSATWGGTTKNWRTSARHTTIARHVTGPSLVLGAWRE